MGNTDCYCGKPRSSIWPDLEDQGSLPRGWDVCPGCAASLCDVCRYRLQLKAIHISLTTKPCRSLKNNDNRKSQVMEHSWIKELSLQFAVPWGWLFCHVGFAAAYFKAEPLHFWGWLAAKSLAFGLLWVAHGWRICLQYRRHRRRGFDSWLGRSLGVGNGNPLQYSCWENPMDRGAWQGPWGHKVSETSDTTEVRTPTHPFAFEPFTGLLWSYKRSFCDLEESPFGQTLWGGERAPFPLEISFHTGWREGLWLSSVSQPRPMQGVQCIGCVPQPWPFSHWSLH